MSLECKFLFIVRHAKSSWNDATLADHDRTLNKRGQRDAPVMAKRLAGRRERPELIVSSPAVRALTTARIMACELGMSEGMLAVEDALYGASADTMLNVIRGTDESVTRLMIVGHNPGLTDFVNGLAGSSIENVPTSGIAVIRFEGVRWHDLEFGVGELVEFDVPKNGR